MEAVNLYNVQQDDRDGLFLQTCLWNPEIL